MTIGDMVVKLGMDTSPLAKGVASARSSLEGLSAGVSKIGSVFGGIGGKLAAIAGIGSFSYMTNQALSSIDATAKLADSIGTSTEALVGLRHAGELSGVSTEQMDKGLNKFIRGIGEARQGIGTTRNVLDQLGLSADHLASVDAGQAFAEVAESIRQLPTEADRAAAAAGVFGRAGQQMLPLIMSGSEGIRDMVSDAERLGMTFSRLDAAKVEQANDAMHRMRKAFGGIFNQAAIGLAPFLAKMADSLTSLVSQSAWVFRAIGDFAKDSFTVISWGFANWETIASYAWASSKLGIVQFGAEVAHFFTGTLPSLFTWFGENWRDIFSTAGNFVKTVFENMGENIARIMSEIWKFISTGGRHSMSLAWTPLLDGFQNTISQLPDIPQRAIGQLEQSLLDETNRLGNMIGDGLGQAMMESWDNAKSVATPSEAMSMLSPEAGGVTATGAAGATSGPVTARQGSVEAYKLINNAFNNQQSAAESRAQKIAERQLAEVKKTNELLLRVVEGVSDGSSPEEVDI